MRFRRMTIGSRSMYDVIMADGIANEDVPECSTYWGGLADQVSYVENYIEVTVECVCGIFATYVLYKVVVERRFFDFFAILIPLLMVTYATMSATFYF